MYFKLKDMEIGNVNDINAQNVDLTPIDSIDVGVREQPPENNDELKYTYDPERGYIPNRLPRAGEPGFSPTSRFGIGETPS